MTSLTDPLSAETLAEGERLAVEANGPTFGAAQAYERLGVWALKHVRRLIAAARERETLRLSCDSAFAEVHVLRAQLAVVTAERDAWKNAARVQAEWRRRNGENKCPMGAVNDPEHCWICRCIAALDRAKGGE